MAYSGLRFETHLGPAACLRPLPTVAFVTEHLKSISRLFMWYLNWKTTFFGASSPLVGGGEGQAQDKSSGVGLSGMVCGWANFKSHPITPITIMGYLMKPTDKEREGKDKPNGGLTGIITREEYSAIMSGLATLASELEHLPRLLEAEKRLRRLEYLMMILVGLLLAVIVLRTG
jgi:hypothetical protein